MKSLAKSLLAKLKRCLEHLKYRHKYYELDLLFQANSEYLKKRYYSVRYGLQGHSLNVVFLMQTTSGWMPSIYEACHADGRINAFVVSIPRKQPLHFDQWRDNEKNFEFLKEQGIDVIKGYDEKASKWFDLRSLKPDVVFVPTPYCAQRHESFSVRQINRYARVAHVQYAYIVRGGSYERELLSHSVFNQFWRVYIESNYTLNSFKKYNEQVDVFVSGYPKLDWYREDVKLQKSCFYQNVKNFNGLKKLLWAPHFAVADRFVKNTSTFLHYYRYFLDFTKRHENVFLVFRPHPMLFDELVSAKLMTADELSSYLSELKALPNVAIDQEAEYIDTMRTADLMVSDNSSFLAMFMPTKRPVIYTHNYEDDEVNLNELGRRITKHYYIAHNQNELDSYLKKVLLKGEDYLKKERIEDLKRHIYMPDEGAGKAIKNDLLKEFGFF